MSREEMFLKVAHERGLEDKYTILMGKFTEDETIDDRELLQLMFHILLGVR